MERTEKIKLVRQLREQILALEGFKAVDQSKRLDFGLGFMEAAFPGGAFPTGAIHEFISGQAADAAATSGFMAGLVQALMVNGGFCLWISNRRQLFPMALAGFGIDPHRVIFIDIKREQDILWVMEEALKCDAIPVVVGELRNISFAESRRLQLAVEQSRVTGFIHRHQPRIENTLTCVTRWKICPLPNEEESGLPGVGFPRWQVELVRVRNGRPGIWQMEWKKNSFWQITERGEQVPVIRLSTAGGNYA